MTTTTCCRLIILILLVGFSATAYSEQLLQKKSFTVSLPDDWVEIPSDVIAARESAIAAAAPNAPAQHYDYGFQLSSADYWFQYPYILVQIKNIGRVSESRLENLDTVNIEDTIEKTKTQLRPAMSDAKVGKMYYEKKHRIIWLRMESNVVNVGPISGLSGMVLTDKGFIQVSGYSTRNEYPIYETVFRSIVLSVTPSRALEYESIWTDSAPSVPRGMDWTEAVGSAIAVAILGGLIALFSGFGRKNND